MYFFDRTRNAAEIREPGAHETVVSEQESSFITAPCDEWPAYLTAGLTIENQTDSTGDTCTYRS